MSTLTEFLLARIAEDETSAMRARPLQDYEPSGMWGIDRVLAECEAKRRIVTLHGDAHECSTFDHHGEVDNCTWCLDAEDCSTMLLLASVYADHPDHREEWRP